MAEWKQERPTWCPHDDCTFVFRVQDVACAGRLPAPVPHGADQNTHQLCIQAEGETLLALQWNRTDAWHLGRLCDAVRTDGPTV